MLRLHGSTHFSKQSGAALLVLMLIFLMASLSLFLNRLVYRPSAINELRTMQTLAQAKEAIIGWSASKSSIPGMLPCPEDTTLIGTLTEGQARSSCGNTLQIGRLPWRTLGLPPLQNDTGESIWYALSAGFRTSPINANTNGQLTVDGIPNRAVAIIFSAGPPLPGQSRTTFTSTTPPDIKQYLEGFNLAGNGAFFTTGASHAFNDRLLIITRADLFRAVNRRILSELKGDEATGLVSYYNKNTQVFPATGSDLPSLLSPLLSSDTNKYLAKNDWYPLLGYSVSTDRKTASLTINAPTAIICKLTPNPPQPTICQ